MMREAAQRGFVHSRLLDLVFLFVLILLGIGLWQWLSTLITGDFMLAWFLVWLVATAIAWWWTREQVLVFRLPTGFLLYLALGLVIGPLSWWSGSKLVVIAESAVLAVGARYLGALGSARLKKRLETSIPWYLDQSIDLIADLARWIGICILAWFAVGVLPLLLVAIMNPEFVPWAALVWSFVAVSFYIYKYRPARWKLFNIPLGLYAFVMTSIILLLFQKQIPGPMEPGSFEQIAYVAYWPAVAAMFVEFVVIGTPKLLRSSA